MILLLFLTVIFHFELYLCDEFEKAATVTTPTTKYLLFIHTPSTTLSYVEMLDVLHEGYMMTFLIEFTRLMTAKDNDAVYDVVKYTDQILRGFYKNDELLWFGQPLIFVTKNVARILKDSNMSLTLDYAARMHNMFSKRKEELTREFNTILENADMQFTDDDGKLLLSALKEFAAYPNITLTGYWLCNRLINNFLRPFRRMGNTARRRELMESVNLELTKRFNSIESNGHLRGTEREKISQESDESSAQEELVTKKEILTRKEIVTTPKVVFTTSKEFVTAPKELVTTPKELVTTQKELVTTEKELVTTQEDRLTIQKEPVTPKKQVTKKEVTSQEYDKSKEILALKKLVTAEKLVLSQELDTSEELVTLKELVPAEKLFISQELDSSDKDETTQKPVNQETHVTKKKHTTDKEQKQKTTKSSRKEKKSRHPQSQRQKKDKKKKKKNIKHQPQKSSQQYDIFRADGNDYLNSGSAYTYE